MRFIKKLVFLKTDKKVDDVKSEILRFKNILADYQDIKLANVYEGLIKKLYYKELKIFGDSKRFNLSKTAAIMLFKFMRYKDEYEVARLHTKTKFSKEFLKKNKDSKIEYYLAPPMLNL